MKYDTKSELIKYLGEKSKTSSHELLLEHLDRNNKIGLKDVTERQLFAEAIKYADNEDMFAKFKSDERYLEGR